MPPAPRHGEAGVTAILSAKMLGGEVYKIYISAAKAKKIIGWEPTVSFEEGLRRLVEYQRGQSQVGS